MSVVENLVASDTELFWTDNPCDGTSYVGKVSVEGGQVVNLARTPECNPADMVLDGPNVYWVMSSGPDDDWESGRVVRTPQDPGESVILIDDQDHPWAVAVDDTYVYWINLTDIPGLGSVLRMAK